MFTLPSFRDEARIRIQVAQQLLQDALNEPAGTERRTLLEALMEVDAAERLLAFGGESAAESVTEGELDEAAPLLRVVGRPD